VTKGHTFTAIDHDHQPGLLRVGQAGRPGGGMRPRQSICANTLNGLLGHPQQSSLRPFPHKRGRKLWGLPLVTHGGSDPCQIHVWESFSKIVVVWHSHPFSSSSSSSSVLAIGEILMKKISSPHSDLCQIHAFSSVLVVRPLPWSLSSSRISSSLIFLSL
jgi:hypothetical protein